MKYIVLFCLFAVSCSYYIGDYMEHIRDESHQNAFLREHRKYVEDMEYDVAAEKHARSWADLLADRCNGLEYSKGSGYGENISVSWGVRKRAVRDIVMEWEIDNRAYAVGCASVMCEEPMSRGVLWFYVCNYRIRGGG